MYLITYTESVVHTVAVDSVPDNEQELMELVTGPSVDSVEYNSYDFSVSSIVKED